GTADVARHYRACDRHRSTAADQHPTTKTSGISAHFRRGDGNHTAAAGCDAAATLCKVIGKCATVDGEVHFSAARARGEDASAAALRVIAVKGRAGDGERDAVLRENATAISPAAVVAKVRSGDVYREHTCTRAFNAETAAADVVVSHGRHV